jgi:hypothetical protein
MISCISDAAASPVSSRIKISPSVNGEVLIAEIGQFLIERLPASTRPYIGQEIDDAGLLWRILVLAAVVKDGAIVAQRITADRVLSA